MASGKFNVRLPTGLHDQLVRRAAEQGVSLNQLVVALLAGAIGWNLSDEEDSDGA